MKEIACAVKRIDSLMNIAEEYIDLAKDSVNAHREIAEIDADFSRQVVDFVEHYHNAITRKIAEYRRENGEPPAPMMEVYNYLHEQQLMKAAKVRNKQEAFKKYPVSK